MYWHTDSKGRLPLQRNTAQGYTDTTHGENLYGGVVSAEEAFEGWRASKGDDGKHGHNANMLHATFCEIGISVTYNPNSKTYGRNGAFWATDFGGQRDQDIFRPRTLPGGAILVDEIGPTGGRKPD
jgi:uncharacterized protein YkwD